MRDSSSLSEQSMQSYALFDSSGRVHPIGCWPRFALAVLAVPATYLIRPFSMLSETIQRLLDRSLTRLANEHLVGHW